MLGRYGGEEFVAILPEVDAAGAKVAGERMRGAVAAAPAVFEGRSIDVTISVGIAALGQTPRTVESLLGEADKALFIYKKNGRNRVSSRASERAAHPS